MVPMSGSTPHAPDAMGDATMHVSRLSTLRVIGSAIPRQNRDGKWYGRTWKATYQAVLVSLIIFMTDALRKLRPRLIEELL
ncbi:hypothetical protein GCM10025859_00690 [Alicyclobacillus fastidiosus]|nr:hypothetical protein GCM10025859_00690 [Alicyclobacillus fastidiosus]